jgi:acyl carrier protein
MSKKTILVITKETVSMSNVTAEQTIIEVLASQISGFNEVSVTEETSLRFDLGLDSIKLVEFLVTIEEKLDIIFDESDIDPSQLHLVRDLTALLNKTLSR